MEPPPLFPIRSAATGPPGKAILFPVFFLLVWATLAGAVIAVDPFDEYGVDLLPPVGPPAGGDIGQKLALLEGAPQVRTVVYGTSTAVNLHTVDLEAAGFGPTFSMASPNVHLGSLREAVDRTLAVQPEVTTVIVAIDLHELLRLQGSSLVDEGVVDLQGVVKAATSKERLRAASQSVWYALTNYPERSLVYDLHGNPLMEATWEGGPLEEIGPERFFAPVSRYDRPDLDPLATSELESFVGDLVQRGLEIHLVLQPVHPDVPAHVVDPDVVWDDLISQAKGVLVGLCGTTVSSYVPQETFGPKWTGEAFSDAVHYGRKTGKQVAQALAAGTSICPSDAS